MISVGDNNTDAGAASFGGTQAAPAQLDDDGICAACNNALTPVRPGKSQCDFCEMQDSMARSIVRLECENDELCARVALLEEEQKLLLARGFPAPAKASVDAPETNAAVNASNGQWSFVLKQTCKRLEHERDQARQQEKIHLDNFFSAEAERVEMAKMLRSEREMHAACQNERDDLLREREADRRTMEILREARDRYKRMAGVSSDWDTMESVRDKYDARNESGGMEI